MVLTLSAGFAATSAAIHVAGYAVYGAQTRTGHSRPNMATWVLWVFLSALNCASYLAMSGDPAKAAVAIAGAAACTATFAYSLKRGRVSRLNAWDSSTLAVGILSAAAWLAWRNATYANLILQFGFFISMIPTYRGVIKDHTAERPLPWFLWGAAYAMNLVVVVFRWQGHAADLAYPLLNMITHAGVGLTVYALSRRPAALRVVA